MLRHPFPLRYQPYDRYKMEESLFIACGGVDVGMETEKGRGGRSHKGSEENIRRREQHQKRVKIPNKMGLLSGRKSE